MSVPCREASRTRAHHYARPIGRPGVQVAAITRRADGFFIVHGESKDSDYPLLNGTAIGSQATRVSDNDVIQLAGVMMGFFEG